MKKWFLKTFCLISGISLILAITIYIVDPLNYFRWNEGKRWLEPRYVTAGIVKNYDFDYGIMGSSMIQNMQIDWFREAGHKKPVKITIGGMDFNEILLNLKFINENNKADKILINLDIWNLLNLSKIHPYSSKYPLYQYNETNLDNYNYFFGFESWFYYMPIIVGTAVLEKVGVVLPDSILDDMNIDKMADVSKVLQYDRDIVLSKYKPTYLTAVNKEKRDLSKYKARIDTLISYFNEYIPAFNEVVFSFPPYSSLYWSDLMLNDDLQDAFILKEYLVENLLNFPNVTIVDMGDNVNTTNLDNYFDRAHFNLDLQKQFADSVLHKKNTLNSLDDVKRVDANIYNMACEFIENNKEIFK